MGEIARRAVRDTLSGDRPAAVVESGKTAANGSAGVAEDDRDDDREKYREEEAWTFSVTDRSSPEAFLFADRVVFLSRGALAALGGEAALESLFRTAALRYAGGGFRSGGGALVEQPVPLPVEPLSSGSFAREHRLPGDGSPVPAAAGGNGGEVGGNGGTIAGYGEAGPTDRARPTDDRGERESPGAAAERWVSLLDGLPLGEPPGRGGARGRDLFLPAAGLRLRAPAGFLFAPGTDGRHEGRHVAERAEGPALSPALTVVEQPLPDFGHTHEGPSDGATDGARSSFETERRLVRALDRRLRSDLPVARVEFVERVRARSVVGVLARLRAAPAAAFPDPESGTAGGSTAPTLPEASPAATADGALARRRDSGASAARLPGPAPGYRALLRTPRKLVEISFACRYRPPGRRGGPPAAGPGAACENSFMEMVRSVERLPAAETPGWLRLRAVSVERRQSADEAIRAFVTEGRSDVPASVLRELNRSRRDRSLTPGDRLLVPRRDPVGAPTRCSAPQPPGR